jgi:hypothetical protein
MEYYMPIMVMPIMEYYFPQRVLESKDGKYRDGVLHANNGYGMNLGIRVTLLDGMSPNVFVGYRSAFATIFLAPIAYFSGYVLISFFVIIPN